MTSSTEHCTKCKTGRVRPYRGHHKPFAYRKGCRLALPEEFEVPTCEACGAEYFDEALSAKAVDTLRQTFLELQAVHVRALVESIQGASGCTLRQIEQACGVTLTYLSHVMKGRNEASDTLLGQLEAFAVYPEEFQRRLERTNCFNIDSVQTAIAARLSRCETLNVKPASQPSRGTAAETHRRPSQQVAIVMAKQTWSFGSSATFNLTLNHSGYGRQELKAPTFCRVESAADATQWPIEVNAGIHAAFRRNLRNAFASGFMAASIDPLDVDPESDSAPAQLNIYGVCA